MISKRLKSSTTNGLDLCWSMAIPLPFAVIMDRVSGRSPSCHPEVPALSIVQFEEYVLKFHVLGRTTDIP